VIDAASYGNSPGLPSRGYEREKFWRAGGKQGGWGGGVGWLGGGGGPQGKNLPLSGHDGHKDHSKQRVWADIDPGRVQFAEKRPEVMPDGIGQTASCQERKPMTRAKGLRRGEWNGGPQKVEGRA